MENEENEEIDFWEWWEMARYGSGNDETIITEYLENTHLEKGIKQKNLDKVLNLIDEYVCLKECVESNN